VELNNSSLELFKSGIPKFKKITVSGKIHFSQVAQKGPDARRASSEERSVHKSTLQ
jgi:hypothetical protein